MIIGDGLLGTAFRQSDQNFENVLVIAAGLSDSVRVTAMDREREKAMIQKALNEPVERIIYFGTTSIYDPLKRQGEYVKHKLQMEELVKQAPQALIIRLPNIVGRSRNPTTLLNFLVEQIQQRKPFDAWIHHRRYLMDVDWIPSMVHGLLDTTAVEVDLVINEGILVGDLIKIIEALTGNRSLHIPSTGKNDFSIPFDSSIEKLAKSIGIPFGKPFESTLIRKYYGDVRS